MNKCTNSHSPAQKKVILPAGLNISCECSYSHDGEEVAVGKSGTYVIVHEDGHESHLDPDGDEWVSG